jgi:hypothetical protein
MAAKNKVAKEVAKVEQVEVTEVRQFVNNNGSGETRWEELDSTMIPFLIKLGWKEVK